MRLIAYMLVLSLTLAGTGAYAQETQELRKAITTVPTARTGASRIPFPQERDKGRDHRVSNRCICGRHLRRGSLPW